MAGVLAAGKSFGWFSAEVQLIADVDDSATSPACANFVAFHFLTLQAHKLCHAALIGAEVQNLSVLVEENAEWLFIVAAITSPRLTHELSP
ncbi:hypothetical protein KW782_00030 [Candidatus Parcubacteria bacterium]|nr:hypothetical protein [Candidatus Parcubacteria bacterium]